MWPRWKVHMNKFMSWEGALSAAEELKDILIRRNGLLNHHAHESQLNGGVIKIDTLNLRLYCGAWRLLMAGKWCESTLHHKLSTEFVWWRFLVLYDKLYIITKRFQLVIILNESNTDYRKTVTMKACCNS